MMFRRWIAAAAAVAASAATIGAQTSARDELARGRALWDQRLAASAIVALEAAARDRSTAAEAHEALGRLFMFKGWQADNVFLGWHDEPGVRDRAIAELQAAVAADPGRASAKEALSQAEAFAAADRVDPAPPRPEVKALDATIESLRGRPDAPVADLVAAIDARIKAQADPTPYFAGAQALIDRGAYDVAIALAERGVAAAERFVAENLSAYQMAGKSQGVLIRARAQAADLVGWALLQKKDAAGAAPKLEEAERLYRGQDFLNQFHQAELAQARGDSARARDHYLNALSLSTGPAPLRQRATQALVGLALGAQNGPSFDAWIEAQLSRRRDDRKAEALKSLLDRPVPRLALRTLDGRAFDLSSLRGKVLLLNFFASW
jgi:hypothetical protein